jgi:hypothetical protein
MWKEIYMKTNILIFITIITLLTGCNTGQQQTPDKVQGRAETRKLEGASASGYDGTAIRKNVDNSLNKNDEHNNELDKANKVTGSSEQKN